MTRADFLFLSSVVMVVTGLAMGVSRPITLRAQVQAPESRPRFEVASVKQNLSSDRRSFSAQPGGRLVVRNFALKDLIAAAFGMADIQALIPERILGGPDWIESERYDIEAKAGAEFQFAPGGPPREALLMLRSLLEERFKLVAHRETREMPIFELVVARKDGSLGAGLHKSSVDCDALVAAGPAGVAAAPRQPGEPPPCRLSGGPARTIAASVTMQQLAANLSNHLGRFVVDKTGLTDRFDFNLGWTPERLPTAAPPPAIPLLLMISAVVLGVKATRNRLPAWAARTVLAVGVLVAASAASGCDAVARTGPLFAQPQDVPSAVESAPSPQYAAAVGRARELVRAAIVEQNLPGVSIAVGMGGGVVWAEGFGWRDVVTQTPVRPETRFNIGTAASAVTDATVASLGLTNTGADAAKEWSPEAIGEEGEDFPPLTLLRHVIWQPLGLMPAEYPLPDDRATFYVPRSEDNNPRHGRRLMYMRDLACCAGTMASYSTAPDLVRVGLANGGSINGELAGGMVSSLLTPRDSGIVVAVLSNIAHANTAALALKVADVFGEQK